MMAADFISVFASVASVAAMTLAGKYAQLCRRHQDRQARDISISRLERELGINDLAGLDTPGPEPWLMLTLACIGLAMKRRSR